MCDDNAMLKSNHLYSTGAPNSRLQFPTTGGPSCPDGSDRYDEDDSPRQYRWKESRDVPPKPPPTRHISGIDSLAERSVNEQAHESFVSSEETGSTRSLTTSSAGSPASSSSLEEENHKSWTPLPHDRDPRSSGLPVDRYAADPRNRGLDAPPIDPRGVEQGRVFPGIAQYAQPDPGADLRNREFDERSYQSARSPIRYEDDPNRGLPGRFEDERSYQRGVLPPDERAYQRRLPPPNERSFQRGVPPPQVDYSSHSRASVYPRPGPDPRDRGLSPPPPQAGRGLDVHHSSHSRASVYGRSPAIVPYPRPELDPRDRGFDELNSYHSRVVRDRAFDDERSHFSRGGLDPRERYPDDRSYHGRPSLDPRDRAWSEYRDPRDPHNLGNQAYYSQAGPDPRDCVPGGQYGYPPASSRPGAYPSRQELPVVRPGASSVLSRDDRYRAKMREFATPGNVAGASPVRGDPYEDRYQAKMREFAPPGSASRPSPFREEVYEDKYEAKMREFARGGPASVNRREGSYRQKLPHSSGSSVAEKDAFLVEIAPGVSARLRRTQETIDAVANDFYTPVSCFACEQGLFCIADVKYFICAHCRVISPLDMGGDDDNTFEGRPMERHGLGMAFDVDSLFRMQTEVFKSLS